MLEVSLYGHARMVPVSVNQGPIALCLSRVPPSAATRTARGPLLLLHGNPANMHDFGRLAALLRDDFEVFAIDLPGFGRSQNVRSVPHETLLDTYARHVMEAADRSGCHQPCYVLGHSHGAAVAQTIAALFPERVRALILLGSVGTPAHWGYRQLVMPGVVNGLRLATKHGTRAIPQALRRRIVQAVMEPIFAPCRLTDRWIDEQLEIVERRPEILVNMALVASGDPCGQLARKAARIRAPALFVHGAADRLVPASHARGVHELLARGGRSEFHELPHTGHMLHISHPERIQQLIVDWSALLP